MAALQTLPAELLFEIGELLGDGSLKRLLASSKRLAPIFHKVLYDRLFDPKHRVGRRRVAQLDSDFFTPLCQVWRSELMVDYFNNHQDKVINFRNRENTTLLHFTAESGNLKLLAVLLKLEADARVVDDRGLNPLCCALGQERQRGAGALLTKDPGFLRRDYQLGWTMLRCAAKNCHLDFFNFLFWARMTYQPPRDDMVEQGLEVALIAARNQRLDIMTLMIIQCQLITPECTSALLTAAARGGDLDCCRFVVHTARSYATRRAIVAPWPAITTNGAEQAHTQFIHILLESGVDVGNHEPTGTPIFSYNSMWQDSPLSRMFTERPYLWRSPLLQHFLFDAVSDGNWGLTNLLLDLYDTGRTDIEISYAYNRDGNTLLYIATAGGHPSIVHRLLMSDADPFVPTSECDTPAHAAVSKGGEAGLQILALLLESNSMVSGLQNSRGYTPFHLVFEARVTEKVGLARLLVSAGAKVNARDNRLRTPLHVCAEHNFDRDAMKFLLEAGAGLALQDEFRQTPFHIAAYHSRNLDWWIDLASVSILHYGCQDCFETVYGLDSWDLLEEAIRGGLRSLAKYYGHPLMHQIQAEDEAAARAAAAAAAAQAAAQAQAEAATNAANADGAASIEAGDN